MARSTNRMMDCSSDDDDLLLSGASTFGRRTRSTNTEDKKIQEGFAMLQAALELSGRKLDREDHIRRIKQEKPDVTDEDRENNLAKVESIAQMASSKKLKTTTEADAYLVAEVDNDGILSIKTLIARASAKSTYGTCKLGSREIFKRAVAESDSDPTTIDPIALLENCLEKLEATYKSKSKVYDEFICPLRKALKASFLGGFLKSGYLESHIPPPELMLWLWQVALCEPCKGFENEEICEQSFLLISKLWNDQYIPLKTKLLNISDLVPLLERYICGPLISLKLAKFFQLWTLTFQGGAVGVSPDAKPGEVVRSCIVAFIRVGLDDVFHVFDERKLLMHLQDLLCDLIDLGCEEWDDDSMKETAQLMLCDDNLAPNGESEGSNECFTLALALGIIPLERSSRHAHHNAARLKAFTAMRALEIILKVPMWDIKVRSVLTSSPETVEVADKATKSVSWLTFASAYVAVQELLDDSATIEMDGPILVSTLQIILMCWETALALSQDQKESDSMISLLSMFEPHLIALSQVAQRSKFDSHFRSAEHKLDVLKRVCQTSRARAVAPSPVQVQTTMFDFLSKPAEKDTAEPPTTDLSDSPEP